MGIRGLTTYIQSHSDKYLQSYELSDCYVVIDGNNIACQLYNWVSKCNSAFGGDYDEYDKTVRDFFKTLQICNISPLVVLDGGYEPRKLNTAKSRLRNRYRVAKLVTPQTQSNHKFFPLMMKEIFKDTLLQLSVPYVQCDFESDDEIAALARNLRCPVLSYDSDFYVYDVQYIPFSTMQLEPVRSPENENKYYMKCKLYSIENFLNSFGGLEKRMLPLLATILGNDYIERSTFSNFFSQLKMPKSKNISDTQKRIVGLLKWLRSETPETALNKVLGHLKKTTRESIAQKITKIMSGYHPVDIHSALGLTLETDKLILEKPDAHEEWGQENYSLQKNCMPSEESYSNEDISSCSGSESDEKFSDSESASSSTMETEQNSAHIHNHEQNIVIALPEWFKNSFRKGNLPSIFHDMLTLNIYLMSPQVEDYSSGFSQDISIPIIQVIYGLLMSGQSSSLNYYARGICGNLQKYCLNASCKTAMVKEFPPLSNQINLPLAERQRILLDTAGINAQNEIIVNKFPLEWRLYIIAMKYWYSHTQQILNSCHIHALVFSGLVLNIVSRIPGYYRTKKSLSNVLKKANLNKETDSLVTDGVSCFSELEELLQNSDSVPNTNDAADTQLLIGEQHCRALADVIVPFHQMSERMKSNIHLYSIATVHAFAQFQSCLLHLRYLNALLNFPFPQIRPAIFYSGTLIYNLYMSFQKRPDVVGYVSHLLQNAGPVLYLYNILIHMVMILLPAAPILNRRRRRKRKRQQKKMVGDSDDSSGDPCGEVCYSDSSNRFSILGTSDR